MHRVYLEQIKKLFEKEKIGQSNFIQGLKSYDITDGKSSGNKIYKKRPYVLYQGIKNGQKIIIKILIRKNYFKFYQREIFVYNFLSKFLPKTSLFLPKLIGKKNNPPTMFIKFIDKYRPLGKSNLLLEKIKTSELLLIVEAINSFHIPKEVLERKIKQLGLSSPFTICEPFSFYYHRYIRETKETLTKILGKKEVNQLEKLFLKTRLIFNREEKYFSWGDANFSNILARKEKNRFDFKFLDFEKVDYAPIFRDYTTLFYSTYLADQSLAFFFKKYLEKKYPKKNFWILFYFKLLIYSFPRQFFNFGKINDNYHQKKIKELTKDIYKKYLNLF